MYICIDVCVLAHVHMHMLVNEHELMYIHICVHMHAYKQWCAYRFTERVSILGP